MNYPKQDSVSRRLQAENLHALDAVQRKGWARQQSIWAESRRDLRSYIREVYRHYFPTGEWTLARAMNSGAWSEINMGVATLLEKYRNTSVIDAKHTLNGMYKESVLRHAYMLDMITPPSVRVVVPQRLRLFESNVDTYVGLDAETRWTQRWSAWVDSYHASLAQNLRLGMINESTPDDAADEIDATRAGSPNFALTDALRRVYDSESVSALSRGILDVSGANGDMELVEIWQTRDNVRVCEVCADNVGLTIEEVEDDIPAHPNCNCYWRLVPKSWADLLRSGNSSDRELARWMDANGELANSMIVRNDDGEPVGNVIVTFDEWKDGQPQAVGSL